MDVGVYFDLRNPPGWRQDWSRLYGFVLEAVEEAEQLGASSAWFSEHHLFDDGYLTQPLTYLSAVAARTKRIRLGTAVVIAPFWNAVQLAEQAVVVDLVSAGRLDLGLGTGYRIPEFELFERDITRRHADTERLVRDVRAAWADPRQLPKAVQDPIPLWLGYAGPKGAARAGRLGAGLLSVDRNLYEPYARALDDGGYGRHKARMKGPLWGYATEDPERDWATVSTHYRYQIDSYLAYGLEGTGAPPPPPCDPDQARRVGLSPGLAGLGFGTPEDLAAEARKVTEGIPVEEVFFWVSLAGMPESMVMEHIQTICTKLRPLLAETDP